ncbi:MAG: 30S ribosomal protein S17 [Dehalococcoidia bacterium]|jgi:small subunit ribosomal protein S17|nr:30S ribosomal protein S17 [Dehalococcoidia bacterium]
MEEAGKRRKTKLGRVVSDKMDKTVVVAVESYRRHSIYKKAVRRIKKFKAHDEHNACQEGDMVRIEETRPLSKEKHWRVVEVISKGEVR